MEAERWRRIEGILAEALEFPEEHRGIYLERACPQELRAEVDALLAASAEAGSYFDDLAVRSGLEESCREPGGELVGRRVGAYRLVGFLGRGGMGTVYRAERADGQFSRSVAVKLLSMGARDSELRRRFLAEREILAQLQHPGIARLFDGGVSEDGTPYFVMELVEGQPIDTYCDEHRLGVEERLWLFLDVCDAVSYAHESHVVHRDLKPANVLVNGDGRVRLLDFGIAKLLRPEAGSVRPETVTGRSPMTPAYAAPEQLLGDPVTEATDVYALGVVLYELLTGLSPYRVDAFGLGPETVRAVCEEPVASPSSRVRAASPAPPEAGAGDGSRERARARGQTAAELARRLRGDLDTIVLEALRKEPERRYPSVAALAEDLRRHLRDLPVSARQDTLSYRASRFVARHAIGVAAGAAIALLTLALGLVSLWLARTRSSQSQLVAEADERTEGLLTQLTELYESADPAATPGAGAASRLVLDAAVERLRAQESFDPETRATLLLAAGRVYRRIGAYPDALPLLETALETRRGLFDPPDERLVEALFELGACLAHSGALERGVASLRDALEMALDLHGDDDLSVAKIRYVLATTYHDLREPGAELEFREAVRVFGTLASEPIEEHANALMALGDVLAVRGDLEGALALYRKARTIHTRLFGGEHPSVAMAQNGIGMLRYSLGEKEEALALLREAVGIQRRSYRVEGHPDLAAVLQNLGNLLVAEGDPEGLSLLEEAILVHRTQPATQATSLGFCLTSLGGARRQLGDPEGAKQAYEEALEVYADQDVQPMFRAQARAELARLLLAEGRSERALELLSAVLDAYSASLPADHPRLAAARNELEEARRR